MFCRCSLDNFTRPFRIEIGENDFTNYTSFDPSTFFSIKEEELDQFEESGTNTVNSVNWRLFVYLNKKFDDDINYDDIHAFLAYSSLQRRFYLSYNCIGNENKRNYGELVVLLHERVYYVCKPENAPKIVLNQ
jgi:hypothetical protein